MNFKKILVLGASGFVGRNFQKNLNKNKSKNFLFPTREELDLFNQDSIATYLNRYKPELVINLAGKVGGIISNSTKNYNYLIDNLYININLIDTLKKSKIKNFLNVSSSCIYPANIKTTIKESELLSGKLEPTNEGYAIAKISALKACEYISNSYDDYNYKSVIPCNLYGPYDKFDEEVSHMIPGVIKRVSDAKKKNLKKISIWGDGKARREFMFIDDFIDFIHFAISRFDELPQNINVGIGTDFTIQEYYDEIISLIEYDGLYEYDLTKPTGMKRKIIDNTFIKSMGWKQKHSLHEGIEKTINYYNEIKNEI